MNERIESQRKEWQVKELAVSTEWGDVIDLENKKIISQNKRAGIWVVNIGDIITIYSGEPLERRVDAERLAMAKVTKVVDRGNGFRDIHMDILPD